MYIVREHNNVYIHRNRKEYHTFPHLSLPSIKEKSSLMYDCLLTNYHLLPPSSANNEQTYLYY